VAASFDYVCMLGLAGLSEVHKGYSLGRVVTLLKTPVELGQYAFFNNPIGFVTYALLSSGDADKMASLSLDLSDPHNWRSGDNLWIVDAVFPDGGVMQAARQLRRGPFKAFKSARWLRTHGTGTIKHLAEVRA